MPDSLLHTPHVLIVEDNDAQRRVLTDLIRAEGYIPIACARAAEAYEWIASQEFAVAVLDLKLPDVVGTEMLRALEAAGQRTQAIIHTGFGSFESARDAVNLGAFAYVEKLGQPEELVRTVHRAVQAWTAERLQRTEEDYRRLIESVQAVVWRALPDASMNTFVSREAEALLGYPVEQWLTEARFWENHIHPEDREETVAYCEQATRERRPHALEYRMIAADGSIVWVRDLVNVLCEGEEVVELVGVMVDITERRRVEAAVQRRDTILAAVSYAARELVRETLSEELMTDVLERMGRAAGVGRAYLYSHSDDAA
ncbi:MAG: response regulator, partial [Rhodothermales bacterium]|nr:response regulator [Rhodothermales bacterium]